MIELTVKELTDSIQSFEEMMSMKVGARLAYLLGRIMREVEKEYTTFQNARGELIKKYGVKDENGELVVDEEGKNNIPRENINKFNQELNELLDAKIILYADPIELKDLEQFEFKAQDMFRLVPFIKE